MLYLMFVLDEDVKLTPVNSIDIIHHLTWLSFVSTNALLTVSIFSEALKYLIQIRLIQY